MGLLLALQAACGRKRMKTDRTMVDLQGSTVHQQERQATTHDPALNQRVIAWETTSKTEYEVDALALKADEGRGDRRNVQGELHASDEP